MLTNEGISTVPGATYEPHRAIAPGSTRTPSSRVFSGTRSSYRKSPTWDLAIGSTRKASRMARLARSFTTTASVAGSTYATLAWPASTASTAATTTERAWVSAGDSSARRSHSSSITSGSTSLIVGELSGPVRRRDGHIWVLRGGSFCFCAAQSRSGPGQGHRGNHACAGTGGSGLRDLPQLPERHLRAAAPRLPGGHRRAGHRPRSRAGGGRGHHRGRRGQARAAAAGGHHRPGR